MPLRKTPSPIRSLLVPALSAMLLAGCGAAATTSSPGGVVPPAAASSAASTAANSAAGAPSTTTATTSAAGPATTQSAAAAGPNGEVAEDLTFSGNLSGHMTRAHRGDTYVCTGGTVAPNNPNTSGQLVVGPMVGDVGGKEVRMNITKITYHGPATYDAGGVSFDVGSDHYFPVNAPSGTLTVSAGGRSGTVSMDLAVNSGTTTTVGHVQGTWQCPADAF